MSYLYLRKSKYKFHFSKTRDKFDKIFYELAIPQRIFITLFNLFLIFLLGLYTQWKHQKILSFSILRGYINTTIELLHCKLVWKFFWTQLIITSCCTHIRTSKRICSTNQLTDFSMGVTLASYVLQYVSK